MALWLRPFGDHRAHRRWRRRDHASLGREAESHRNQGGHRLCSLARGWSVLNAGHAIAQASTLPEEGEDFAPLYEVARKVYPQRVSGVFRRLKTAILLFAL